MKLRKFYKLYDMTFPDEDVDLGLISQNAAAIAAAAATAAAKKAKTAVTLAAAATAIAKTSDFMVVTGDVGGNTVATITGGEEGDELTLLFVDTDVTITDTDAHTADTVDLSAAFTSADDTMLKLKYDGTSWYEVSRSVN